MSSASTLGSVTNGFMASIAESTRTGSVFVVGCPTTGSASAISYVTSSSATAFASIRIGSWASKAELWIDSIIESKGDFHVELFRAAMASRKYDGRYRMSATPAILMAQLSAASAITLMLVWILHFREGFSLKANNLDRLLNAHHVLMLFGPIIATGQAAMAFKTVPGRRRARKVVHMLLNLAGIALGGLGLFAIFKFYSKSGAAPSFHSLHSWTGLAVIGLSVIQFFVGFTCFLFPGSTLNVRANVRPWHAFFGVVIFILAILTSSTGLIQRFRFLGLLKGREALVLNFTGISIILFGIFVVMSLVLP